MIPFLLRALHSWPLPPAAPLAILFLALLPIPAAAARATAEENLLAAEPMFGRATEDGITWSVIGGSRPLALRMQLATGRAEGGKGPRAVAFVEGGSRGDLGGRWVRGGLPSEPGTGTLEVRLEAGEYFECVLQGLDQGRPYRWWLEVMEADPGERQGKAVRSEERRGRFVTVRPRGSEFDFALIADMHFFVAGLGPQIPAVDLSEPALDSVLESVEWFRHTRRRIEAEYRLVARNVTADRPDFVVGLGDHFDLHGLEFNGAFRTRRQAETAHSEARRVFSDTLQSCGAYYQLIGNWEGESGDHSEEARSLAIRARRRHQLNPRPDTPGCAASIHEDYYAFRWGDVQFLALNVRGYTPRPHNLGSAGLQEGGADDYTLGETQRAFAETVLRQSELPYKVVLIHHVIGGNAGDAENSAYGRGGGRAAKVGEQAWLHELMQETGAQALFYGHDHVFTDMVVDGIHYSLPGTTGAPWRFDRQVTGYEEYWTQSGHGRVKVRRESMQVEFVDYTGRVLHSFELFPRVAD